MTSKTIYTTNTSAFGITLLADRHCQLEYVATFNAAVGGGAESLYYEPVDMPTGNDRLVLDGAAKNPIEQATVVNLGWTPPGQPFYMRPGDGFRAVGAGNVVRRMSMRVRYLSSKEIQERYGVDQSAV